jgi:hypothetical protein
MFSMSYKNLLNLPRKQEGPLSWVEQGTGLETPEASSH